MKRTIMIMVSSLVLSLAGMAQGGINDPQASGHTPLIERVRAKDVAGVEGLLAQGADVNAQDPDGMRALIYACQGMPYRGETPLLGMESRPESHALSVRLVQSLLAAGADVNVGNQDGVTPLMSALDYDKDIVGLLLAAHADVNKMDNQGQTALMRATRLGMAVESDGAAFQRLLLKSGADPRIKDSQGMTAFLLACGFNYFSPDLVEAYLKNGADVKDRDADGRTPLIRMAATQYTNLDSLKLLIGAGADINAQDSQGNTALLAALSVGSAEDPEEALFLIDQKSNLALVNAAGQDALHVLAQTRYSGSPSQGDGTPRYEDYELAVLDRMIAAGVNVNGVDKNGNTALLLFLQKAEPLRTQPAQHLLAAGADCTIKNNEGKYAFEWAFNNAVFELLENSQAADPELYAALLEKSTDIRFKTAKGPREPGLLNGDNPFEWAIEHNHSKIVRLMMQRGMSVNRPMGDQYSDYSSPLLVAALAGQTDMVKFLVAQGADVNAKSSAHGYTSLIVACDKGNLEMAKALLKAGASVKALPKGGQPALAFAVSSGNLDLVKLLVANNASVDASWDPNGTGYPTTILDAAVEAASFKAPILSFLIAAKANVNPKGSSPLLSAVREGNAVAVDLLIAAKANVNYFDGRYKETPLSAAKARKLDKIATALVKAGAK